MRLTAKQAPHRPGISAALGLRAGGDDFLIVPQTARDTKRNNLMPKDLTAVIAISLATLLAISPGPARKAPTFKWEYVNPADPSQGKQQSTMLVPDGAGANAVPWCGPVWPKPDDGLPDRRGSLTGANARRCQSYQRGAEPGQPHECELLLGLRRNIEFNGTSASADLTGAEPEPMPISAWNANSPLYRTSRRMLSDQLALRPASYQARDLDRH